MKKFLCILFFSLPVVVSAQFNLYKDSPLDYAWKYVGNAGFSAGVAYGISFAFSPSNNQPYVAYQDREFIAENATVMMFNGTNWVNVGNAGFSTDFPENISLAFSPSESFPYVAYSDLVGSGLKATVMMFNGTNWMNVGNAGFSAGEADCISLAFSPSNNQPYVAYEDYGNSQKATVMTFNGTDWVNVGNAGFSAGETEYESLAFNPSNNQPYVAFEDEGNSGKATVMRFNGINWVNVGNAGFSAGRAWYISLAFSPWNDQPYVAYADWGNLLKATVMMFNGTDWVDVGNAGFSAGYVYSESLAFHPPDGEPYVAFSDASGFATVMKYNGTNWVYVGNEGFSAGVVYSPSLAFSPIDNQPYVAYEDATSGFAMVMKYDSVMVGINELLKSTLSLYPNPATDKITVELSGITQGGNITIVDIEGQELITRHITEPKTQIDISSLPSGVYFVQLTGERTVEVGKIIKE